MISLGKFPLNLIVVSHLGFMNIACYLQMKKGTPSDQLFHELNVDDHGLNCYHIMLYRGQYDCLVTLLCLERLFLKKVMHD